MSSPLFRRGVLPLIGLISLLCYSPSATFGQMVTAGFPLVGVRDSFSEGIRTNWALRGDGAFRWFNNNSGSGIPQFGGFTPGAGLSGGFGINAGGFGSRFGFNFAQGSSRSMVSNTPIVTGFAGQPLMLQNTLQRPFVTNLIPVVGNGGVFQDLGPANTIRGRLLRGEFRMENGKVIPAGGSRQSPQTATASRVFSHRPLVDAAPPTRAEREARKSAKEAKRLAEIRKYLQKGKDAEAEDKPNVAKLYYQMAARRADGDLKREALASLDRVGN